MPHQIPALTGLRFLAAAFILIAHGSDWIVQFSDSHVSRWLSFLEIYGMPLFFVLSGFVIHYNYRSLFESRSYTEAILRFSTARFARLYPLYLFFLAFSFLADGTLMHGGIGSILPYYLTLTQSWFYQQINGHLLLYYTFGLSWSISTEMFFYIAYTCIVPLLIMLTGTRRSIAAAGVFCLVVLFTAGVTSAHLDQILAGAEAVFPDYVSHNESNQNSFFTWAFYFSPYIRVFEFVLGCMTAQLFIELRRRPVTRAERWGGQAILIVALLGLAVFGHLALTHRPAVIARVGGFLIQNFGCAPEIAIVIFCAARYDTLFSRLVGGRLLVALGETSYSIYVVHTWTLRLFQRAPDHLTALTAFDAGMRFLFGFVFTLIVSSATYRLIEVPARQRLRRWSARAISAIGSATTLSGTTPQHRWVSGLAAMLGLLGACAAVQFGGQAYGALMGSIRVDDASYGLNCRDFSVQPPFSNSVVRGNATLMVRQACNGRPECDFEVSVDRLGDPANSCGKDFSVEYHCLGGSETRQAYLPGEANGARISLRCSKKS